MGEGEEGVAEEALAFFACPGVVIFPSAEDVEGDERELGGNGGVEGGVVGEAEIAAEPEDGGGGRHGGKRVKIE